MTAARACLGMGSNIDARNHIPSAMAALREAFDDVRFSPVYQSPAVGFEGDDFLNLVACVETRLAPLELEDWLHQLENAHGRDRSAPRWSSRTLDIDILLYGDLWLLSPVLQIPREEILTASHVLKPLADIASEFIHPVERKPISELWSQFPKQNLTLTPVTL